MKSLLQKISFLTLTLAFVFPFLSYAAMSSGNYKMESDSINFAGARSSSASFITEDSAGEVGTGDLTGATHNLKAGYQQTSAAAANGSSGGPAGGSAAPSGTISLSQMNAMYFTAIPSVLPTQSIILSWKYPTDGGIVSVRIIRSTLFFPATMDEGEIIYDGEIDGDTEQVIDHNVVAGTRYYYALFAKNALGEWSSGVLAQARIVPAGEALPGTPGSATDPFADIPDALNVDAAFANLSLDDFDFIQDGRSISHAGETIALDASQPFTVRLDYSKVPEILKTIAISLADPADTTKIFTFLLRVNKDKTAYEATIGSLERSGNYQLNAVVLDYKNQSLKRLQGSLQVFALGSARSFLREIEKNPAPLYGMLVLLFIAFCLITFFVLYNRHRKLKKALAVMIIFFLLSFSTPPAYAAINQQINYQGKLTNNFNEVVGGDYHVRFNLYSASSGGTAIWTQTSRVSVVNGLFSIMLSDFTGVDFNQTLYLGVEIGGYQSVAVWDGEMSPRKVIGAVPAAFVADTLDGLDSAQFLRSDTGVATQGYFVATSTTATSTFAGSVGVGTSTPAKTFSVNGESYFNNTLTLENVTPTVTGNKLYANSSNLYWAGNLIGGATTGNWTTDGTHAWRATGNVGVGTSSPGQKLSVAGDILGNNIIGSYFTATSTTATSTISTGGFAIGTSTPFGNGLFTVGTSTPLFYVDRTNGKVGVGMIPNSSGTHIFDVYSNAGTTGSQVFAGFGGHSSGNATIYLEAINGLPSVTSRFNHALLFAVNDSERMRISTDGFLGIGTTSPWRALSVHGSSDLGTNALAGSFTATSTTATSTFAGGFAVETSGLVYDFSSNNVGIGTTSPGVLLHTFGDTNTQIENRIENPNTGSLARQMLRLKNDVSSGALVYHGSGYSGSGLARSVVLENNDAAGDIQFYFNGGYNVVFNDDGNIGIGTTTPWGLLSVNPNALASGVPQFVVGSSTATNFIVTQSGNVGIGTASPGESLEIHKSTASTATHIGSARFVTVSTGDISDGFGSAIYLGMKDAAGSVSYGSEIVSVRDGADNSQALTMSAMNAGTRNSGQLWLDASGYVGIGTTSPSEKLSIVGGNFLVTGSLRPEIKVAGSDYPGRYGRFTALVGNAYNTFNAYYDGTNWQRDDIDVGSSNVNYGAGAIRGRVTGSGSGNITWTEAFYANTTGFGIGTTSPWRALSVHGSSDLGINALAGYFTATTSTASVFPYASTTAITSSGAAYLNSLAIGSYAAAGQTAAPSNGLIVSGNVGVGTTSPSAILHVARLGAGEIARFRDYTDGGSSGQGLSIHLNEQADGTDVDNLVTLSSTGNSTGSLAWGTGTAERVRITSAGNVGIGTTSPWRALSVHGSSDLGTNALAGYFTATTSTASVFPYASTTAISSSGSAYFATSGGSVGIGTTSPGFLLSLAGATGSNVFMMDNTSTTISTNDIVGKIGFSVSGESSNLPSREVASIQTLADANYTGTDSAQTSLAFFTHGQGTGSTDPSIERFRVDGSGKFSIGTTSPSITTSSAQLVVGAGVGSATTIKATNYDLALFGNAATSTTASLTKTGLQIYSTGTWSGANSKNIGLYVSAVSGGTNNYDAIFNGGGNVGIGTTSPFAKLSLTGTAASTGYAFAMSDSNNITRFAIQDNGNITIGTSSPLTTSLVQMVGSYSQSSTTPVLSVSGANGVADNYLIAQFGQVPNGASWNGYGSGYIRVQRLSNGTGNGALSATDIEQNSAGSGPFRFSTTYGDTNIANMSQSTNGQYGNINLVTNNAIRLIVAGGPTAGNVGVGTSSPYATLSVTGRGVGTTTLALRPVASQTANILDIYSTSGVLTSVINSSGNWGLGTTTPWRTLSVHGSSDLGINALAGYFTATSSTASVFPYASTTAISSSGSAYFVTSGTGSVGIGTTNPLSKLHILSGTQSVAGEHDDGIAIFEGPNVTGSKAIANISSNTAFGVDVGASLGFSALYRNSATDPAMLAKIIGAKENSTNANYAGYMALFTTPHLGSATERMRIDSTGNVGIGTTTPGQKLSVAGDILGNNIIGSYFTATSSTASTFPYASTTAISSSGSAYFATSGGNVGIGSTSPMSLLSIQSTGANALEDLVNIRGAATSNGFYTGIKIWNNTGGVNSTALRAKMGAAGLSSFGIYLKDNAGNSETERFSINSTGEVGIGTTSPYAKLSVTNTGTGPTFVAEDSTSPDTTPFIIDASGNVGIGTTTPLDRVDLFTNSTGGTAVTSNNIPYLRLKTYSANASGNEWYLEQFTGGSFSLNLNTTASGGSVFVANSSGNIGISSTSPYAKLSVTNTGTDPSFVVEDSTSPDTTPFIIDQTGLVGIGIASPADKLHVVGDLRIQGSNSSADTITNNINFNNSYVTSSPLAIISVRTGAAASNSNLIFQTADSGVASEKVRITGAGNVGIGTTTPWRTLSVHGSSDLGINALAGYFTATSTTASVFPYASTTAISSSGSAYFATSAGLVQIGGVALGSNKLDVYTASAGTVATFQSNGAVNGNPLINVAIGGSTVTGNVDGLRFTANNTGFGNQAVYQSGTGVARFYALALGAGDAQSTYEVNGSGAWSMGLDQSDGQKFKISSSTALGTSDRFVIDGNGNVGIGTTTPGTTLGVQGRGLFADSVNASIFIATSTTATSTFAGGLVVGASSEYVFDHEANRLNINSPATLTGALNIAKGGNSYNIQLSDSAAALRFTSTGGDISMSGGGTVTGATGNLTLRNTSSGDIVFTPIGNVYQTTGNMGISTTTPWRTLSVHGSSDLGINALAGSFTATSTTATSTFAGGLAIETSGFVYDFSTNNVGIGTAAPQKLLELSSLKDTTLRLTATKNDAGALDWVVGTDTSGALEFYSADTGIVNTVGFVKSVVESTNGANWGLSLGTATGGAATAKVYITNAGNVGIGTTSPQGKLDVSGTTPVLVISDQSAMAANVGGKLSFYNQYNSGGSVQPFATIKGIRENAISASNSGALLFYVGANGSGGTLPEVMRINSSGNVGIGTTTPASKAHIYGTTAASSMLTIDRSASSYGAGLTFAEDNVATWVIKTDMDGGAGGKLQFNTSDIETGVKLTLQSNGNLGIGTTTPWRTLSVHGSSDLGINALAGYFTATSSTASIFPYASTTAISSSGSAYFVTSGSGNVGIGTTSPLGILSLDATSPNIFIDRTTTSNEASINFQTQGTYDWEIGTGLQTGSTFDFRANSGVKMTLDTSGNLGIGTTTPWGSLSVTNTGTNPSFVVEDSTSPDTTPFIIDASGNVGVGTTSPATLLSLYQTTGPVLRLERNDTAVDDGDVLGGLEFYTNDASASATGIAGAVRYTGGSTWSGSSWLGRLGFFTTNGSSGGPASSPVERMSIDNSGNVGIGTTGPGALLDVYTTSSSLANHVIIGGRLGPEASASLLVNPYIAVTTSAKTDVGAMKIIPTITDNISGVEATNYRGLWIATPTDTGAVTKAYSLYVDAPTQGTTVNAAAIFNGNVGIGTTTPSSKLTITNTTPAITAHQMLTLYSSDAMAADKGGTIGFGGNYTTGGDLAGWASIAGLKENATSGNLAGYLQFGTRSGAGSNAEVMRITSTGLVGIGTTTPNSILNVSGATPKITLSNTSGGTNLKHWYMQSSAGDFIISTTSDALSDASTPAFTILDSGYVGIGTAAPSTALEIGTTASTGNYVKVLGSPADTTYLVFSGQRQYPKFELVDTYSGGSTFNFWNLGNTMRFGTNTGTVGASAWYTKAGDRGDVIFNGLVGIGTTTPWRALSVHGSSDLGTNALAGYFTATTSTASVFPYASTTAISSSGSAYFATSGGNVGIGTTVPGTNLTINKTTIGDASATYATTLANSTLMLQSSSQTGSQLMAGIGGDASHVWIQGQHTDSTTRKIVLNPIGGNVGIGTTTPLSILHVADGTPILRIDNETSNANGTLDFYDSVSGGVSGMLRASNNSGNDLITLERGATLGVDSIGLFAGNTMRVTLNSTEQARFTTTGLGIGTTTPPKQLTIQAAGTPTFGMFDSTQTTGNRGWIFQARTTENVLQMAPAGDTGTAIATGLTINRSGQVGSGTTTPYAQLSVTNTGTGPTFVAEDSTSPDSTPFIIDASGNVGIGSTSPNAALVVANGGNLRITNISAGEGLFGDNGGTSGLFSFTRQDTVTSADLSIAAYGGIGLKGGSTAYDNSVASGYHMYITTAGNVGIGTTTPASKVHVSEAGSAILTLERVDGSVTANDEIGEIKFYADDTSTVTNFYLASIKAIAANTVGTDINPGILTFNTTGTDVAGALTERMRIDSSGNVGIGTTTPGSPLDVYQNTAATVNLNIANALATSYSQLRYSGTGRIWQSGVGNASETTFGVANKYFVYDSTGGAMRMVIDTSGNVGIGTTTPWRALSVHGSSDLGINALAGYFTATTSTASVFPYASTTAISSSGSAYFATSGGSVGIGTTTPQALLDTNGMIRSVGVNVPSYGSGAEMYLNSGVAYFGGYNRTSSASLPVNIGSVDGYLRVTAAGLVGIGTTTPGQKLSVAGDILGNNIIGSYFTATTTTASTFPYASTTAISSSGSAYFATSGGNVGIGTTTPLDALDVYGAGTRSIRISGSGSSDQTVKFGKIDTSETWTIGRDNTGNNFAIEYAANITGGLTTSAPFAITTNGNVGIGTTSPWRTLSVHGSSDLGINALAGYFTATTSTASVFPYASTTMISATTASTTNLITSGQSLFSDGTAALPSVSWLSDPDTGWFHEAANRIALSVGGSARLYIDAVRIQNMTGAAGTPSYSFASDTTTGMWYGGTQSVAFSSNGSERMRIVSGGNVGIGTTTPNNMLDIYSTTKSAIGFSGASGDTYKWTMGMDVTNGGRFSIASSTALGTSDMFVINGAGFVGIGTTSPYAALSVVGATGVVAQMYTATSTTATTTLAGGLNVGNGALQYDFSTGITSIQNLELGAFSFDTDAGVISWADLPISSGSAAGTVDSYTASIGGTSILTVYGEADGSGAAQNTRVGVGSTTPFARLSVNGAGAGTGWAFAVADVSSTTRFMIQDNGKVGIGTSSPVSTLSIQGSLCVRDTGSCGTTDGTIYATTAAVTDIDLAENYPTRDSTLVAGEIVMSDETAGQVAYIKRADKSQAGTVMGIISTAPGLLLGRSLPDITKPVALSGRVPVKVNNEGGAIAVGDRIALSSTPGVGMKAGMSGETVGIALEPFIASSTTSGVIDVFVNLRNNLDLSPLDLRIDLLASTTMTIDTTRSAIVEFFASIKEWVGDKITVAKGYFQEIFADKVTTKELCIDDVCVTKDQLQGLLTLASTTAAQASTTPPTSTPEPTPTVTPTPTPTVTTPSPAPTPTVTATPEVTPTPTPTVTPEVTPVATPEPTATATPTVTPETTPTPEPEATPAPEPVVESAPAPVEAPESPASGSTEP